MDSIVKDKTILLGVSGGIAAYKAVELAGLFVKAGAVVNTVMTDNATRLVQPRSFEAITSRPVFTTMWHDSNAAAMNHIALADSVNAVVVAPATANIIAKAANGICDDLLSTTICACWRKPVLIAPAMNDRMWENPAVQANVKILKANMGFEFTGPHKGRLACGYEAVGRMSEPAEIFAAIEKLLKK